MLFEEGRGRGRGVKDVTFLASGCRSALMAVLLASFVQVAQSTYDEQDHATRKLLAAGEDEFAMQQPQVITQPAGGPSAPLMKAAVNGRPVYYFQPSKSVAPTTLGSPPTYFIDPRILQKAQLNTLKAKQSHARIRAQSLEGEEAGGGNSILDVAAFVFVAIGGTLLVFIRVGIPSAFVK